VVLFFFLVDRHIQGHVWSEPVRTHFIGDLDRRIVARGWVGWEPESTSGWAFRKLSKLSCAKPMDDNSGKGKKDGYNQALSLSRVNVVI